MIQTPSSDTEVTLHFAHANGFPSASYNKLFGALPEAFNILALDKFGHSPRFPINNNWRNQAEEMIDYLDSKTSKNQKVYAVGHSFGAVVSYLAACLKPEKFNGLIMLDPPLASGFSRHLFALAKKSTMIDKITPARLVLLRRRSWHYETDLVEYFSQRGLFKSMDPDCIADYIAAVMRKNGNERVLNFDPAIEAEVFRTIPDNLHRYAGKLKCHGTIITGTQTKVCIPILRYNFIRKNRLTHLTMPGGHMFPMEKPIDVANKITEVITSQSH